MFATTSRSASPTAYCAGVGHVMRTRGLLDARSDVEVNFVVLRDGRNGAGGGATPLRNRAEPFVRERERLIERHIADDRKHGVCWNENACRRTQ